MLKEVYNQEQIYQEFHPKVLRYLTGRTDNLQDAEDLAQTVFVKVYSKLDGFDSSKSSLSTWIFNITRNTLIDHMRARRLRVHGELPETLEADSGDVIDDIILEDEQERLADALQNLEEEERDLIILHYYKGYTLVKVADMMHRPYGQIKRLHNKALGKLKIFMG